VKTSIRLDRRCVWERHNEQDVRERVLKLRQNALGAVVVRELRRVTGVSPSKSRIRTRRPRRRIRASRCTSGGRATTPPSTSEPDGKAVYARRLARCATRVRPPRSSITLKMAHSRVPAMAFASSLALRTQLFAVGSPTGPDRSTNDHTSTL
jgi:hypothetical protein